MIKKENEDRIKLIENLGGIIKEGVKPYGIIYGVWGIAILIGFTVFQMVELFSVPWYYGLSFLILSLACAFIATSIFNRKIGKLGYTNGGWLGDKIKKSWLVVTMIGGMSYMVVLWSPPVTKIILDNLTSGEISGFILMGWLIIDGIGSMIQGIISESKAFTTIGVSMVISSIIVANIGFIYSWSAFALTFGLGYTIVGLRDYYSFRGSKRRMGRY